MTLLDEAARELTALDRALAVRDEPDAGVQSVGPVHTVLWPADRFGPDTVAALGVESWKALAYHGPDPHSFAEALGVFGGPREPPRASVRSTQARRFREDPQALRREDFDAWLIHAVHARVERRLEVRPVEDLRIDFEGRYGTRDDAQEDHHAGAAADAVLEATRRGTMPSRVGLRSKPLSRRSAGRAIRTLERFFDGLGHGGEGVPEQLVLTLPQVQHVEQVSMAAHLLDLLEARHRWSPGRIQLELVLESPRALFDMTGRCTLPGLVRAAAGRCVGVHLDREDLADALHLAPPLDPAPHPLHDIARGLSRLALGSTPVTLSDAVVGPLPEGPHPEDVSLTAAQRADNLAAVHRAWRSGHAQILHALEAGVSGGWDHHGAQLPVRYAANYRFFLARFDTIAGPLHELLTAATSAAVPDRHGDDVRRGQRLLTFVRRAHRCGAIGRAELEMAGLTEAELGQPRFVELVAQRRRRAAEGSNPQGS